MTLASFKKLDKLKRVELTLEKGSLVARRLDSSAMYKLYLLDGFYVELWVARDQSEVFAVDSCDTYRLVDPYLKLIDISSLFL
jgi:hypothetical protein